MPSPVFPPACDVVLRDGSTVAFRTSRDEDVALVRRFFENLSAQSRYQRFLGLPRLDQSRIRQLIAETADSCVLLAWCGGQIVGVAGFYRDPAVADRAEVAFAIADAFQGATAASTPSRRTCRRTTGRCSRSLPSRATA